MATTYRIVNVSVLAALVLSLCAILVTHLNGAGSCWLRACCGRDCLLCGCTRDVMAIVSGVAPTRNALSVYCLVALAGELGWRVLASVVPFGLRVVRADLAVHGLAAAFFMFFNVAWLLA